MSDTPTTSSPIDHLAILDLGVGNTDLQEAKPFWKRCDDMVYSSPI